MVDLVKIRKKKAERRGAPASGGASPRPRSRTRPEPPPGPAARDTSAALSAGSAGSAGEDAGAPSSETRKDSRRKPGSGVRLKPRRPTTQRPESARTAHVRHGRRAVRGRHRAHRRDRHAARGHTHPQRRSVRGRDHLPARHDRHAGRRAPQAASSRGRRRNDDTRIVVIDFHHEIIGFLVDRVLRVVKAAAGDIERHPVVHATELDESVRGVFRTAGALTILLDLDKLLDHGALAARTA